jgi:hypothetical protein
MDARCTEPASQHRLVNGVSPVFTVGRDEACSHRSRTFRSPLQGAWSTRPRSSKAPI